jgi:zinc protease
MMQKNYFKIQILSLFVLIFVLVTSVYPQKKTLQPKSKTQNNSLSTVFLPNRSPLVSFRIQFLTGAMDDPQGKEGVASLTAAILAQGGSKKMTYDQIVEQFYPMATGFGWQVDKEMTTFSGTTHVDNLDKYYSLIRQMLLEPGFREEDFNRLRQDAINFLTISLREGNDEELGKERLYNLIYAGNPYAHHNIGKISSLQKLTLKDLRDFYAKNYTRANLVLGISGNYSTKFSKELYADFQKLPSGVKINRQVAQPKLVPETKIDIVQRETRATAISMGFPIMVNRAHRDFPALALVASYFGQHRSSNSYLYQRIREKRGLNYGDYSYIEYFPRGMFQFEPDPNLSRQSQIFQIWIRPVEPINGHFTLRAAMYEFDKLTKNGITKEDFEATREFLSKYVNILTQTQDAALGYALDSKYYGIGDFNNYMKQALAKLTLEDVNRAIKTHLASKSMQIVMITKDAESLRNAIISNAPSPITYQSEKPPEILDEDKIIQNYKIMAKPTNVTITPVARVFE